MSLGFVIVNLWNGFYGLKMLEVNFVNVILARQTWVRRHYMALLLGRRMRKGLLEYYYLVYF